MVFKEAGSSSYSLPPYPREDTPLLTNSPPPPPLFPIQNLRQHLHLHRRRRRSRTPSNAPATSPISSTSEVTGEKRNNCCVANKETKPALFPVMAVVVTVVDLNGGGSECEVEL